MLDREPGRLGQKCSKATNSVLIGWEQTFGMIIRNLRNKCRLSLVTFSHRHGDSHDPGPAIVSVYEITNLVLVLYHFIQSVMGRYALQSWRNSNKTGILYNYRDTYEKFRQHPNRVPKLLLPDIMTMRLLMLAKGESIDKTYLSFISQSDGFIKIFNKFWFRQFPLLRVTNVTFRKFDLPRYALRAKLNEMVQYRLNFTSAYFQ